MGTVLKVENSKEILIGEADACRVAQPQRARSRGREMGVGPLDNLH
jgi:hypothetical protein